ncbi:MAG: asparagine synthase (glutamine-hydrolyzing) [Wenzhouxiangella sp.]
MCGIAGMIIKDELPPGRIEQFIASADLMQHRGPDYKGVYRKGKVILIHHRLSIIDLSVDANQPFHRASGRMVTAYNGEIYNYRELRHALTPAMRTHSDTEVMIESFECGGSEAISSWNGIFATAIHDQREDRLHLIRDRFGVKPLYFLETDEAIVFASEAKVILHWLDGFRISSESLAQFMLYGHMTGSRGFVDGLTRLEPAQHLIFDAYSARLLESRMYWALEQLPEQSILEADAIQRSRQLVTDAVKRQLISDVPVGLFLSGGIDSSTVAALASQESHAPLDAYSIEYDVNVGGKSEIERARFVADRFGLNHHEITLAAKDAAEVFSDVVMQYDEPFADPAGIALYQLSKACGQRQRVVLQGDGGDELFGGYRRYGVLKKHGVNRLAASIYRLLPSSRLRQRLERLYGILSIEDQARLIARYLTEEVPGSTPARMLGAALRQSEDGYSGEEDYLAVGQQFWNRDLVQQILYVDMKILLPWKYLEKVDKATMRFGIESRVPFLDNELADFVLALPSAIKLKGGKKKHILKEAMRGLVPDSILFGRKRGFDVPVRAWMQNGLHDYAADLFNSSDPGLINRDAALAALSAYRNGALESVPLLWKTMVLAQWLHLYRGKIRV